MANSTITALYTFDITHGQNPLGGVTFFNGNLYGTTNAGGANDTGTVFELSPTGTLIQSASFTDAGTSFSSLTAYNGNLYGTTSSGGLNAQGSVFEYNPTNNTLTTLGSFTGTAGTSASGFLPYAGLTVDNGNLYGTTVSGGANGDGTIFEYNTTTDTLTTLYSFSGTDGSTPFGGLTVGQDGNLYGTTQAGGASSEGTLFEFNTTDDKLSTLASFNGTDGANPYASVITDAQGNLYGTTFAGGADGNGTVFEYDKANGSLTTLGSFDVGNGANPLGGLIADANGNLFGAASSGGTNGSGTVFEYDKANGHLTALASFDFVNGSEPQFGSLVVDSTGNLYGTTNIGGTGGSLNGTVFEVTNTGFVTCFCVGTRLATAEGEKAVETLAIGDLLLTASGEARPVKWLGHRTVDCRRHTNPQAAWPIRISAHAFGEGRPARDLFVSPGHSICVDVLGEVLIPVASLLNSATIAQVEVDEVTYWHVELESHDILLAENLPAESYLDVGNRNFFAECGVTDLNGTPDAPFDPHADTCRPFHETGAIVEAIHHQLRIRAQALGWRLVEETLADLHLIADGKRIEPDVQGLSIRFVVPASVQELWLVSKTSVPKHIGRNSDQRILGICLVDLSIDDGLSPKRMIGLNDPRLSVGFHDFEEGRRRWTNGRTLLPQELWAGCQSTFFLRLDLAAPALPRWLAPNSPTIIAHRGSASAAR